MEKAYGKVKKIQLSKHAKEKRVIKRVIKMRYQSGKISV